MQRSKEFLELCDMYRKDVNEIDKQTLQQWLDSEKSLHLIDVREADEFTKGHLENAVYLSKGLIEFKIHQVVANKNDTVVLYCGAGNRSVLAAYNLQKMGYNNVYSLIGGYKGW